MRTDKDIKKWLKANASENPDKYYATDVLRANGYMRRQCSCGTFFWTVNKDQTVCGDSACSGGFRLFEKNPCKRKMTYVEVWKEFAKMFTQLGYTPIDRYPVVARWNPTAEFTMASIAAFQPFVISGEVEPPANPLVIPQFSIRFSDIENIGITASHQTGFVMIGQHMFVSPKEWDQDRCFSDILKWLTDGLGLPFEEITFHEDAWAGGGNSGPCMEYFSRGVELGNQVYMLYEQTPDDELVDLKIKVLDMGMGMERNAWFSQATATQHHAVYPLVVSRLMERTKITFDEELMKRFIPLSGYLNIDEVDDIDKAWKRVADELSIEVSALKDNVVPMSGIFSIADHMRTILFTLTDGALPSNVGGGYNLRILIRRSLGFIDRYGWDIDLGEVCEWHAEELEEIFPELKRNLSSVKKILDVEKRKYEATKQKTAQIVEKIIDKDIDEEMLIELYDSNGIAPEMVIAEAAKKGKTVDMPENFFGKVSMRHEKKEQAHTTKREHKIDLEGISDTEGLYYDDYLTIEFDAKVLRVIGNNIILNRTAFYPTSGGQMNDIGMLSVVSDGVSDGAGSVKIVDAFKQGGVVVHVMDEKTFPNGTLKEGDSVHGSIDIDRRRQLTQHHTTAHVINVAARNVLGNHVNQAGAKKSVDKAHLDVTHFEAITQDEQNMIEEEANRIVAMDKPIIKSFIPRGEAEKRYGMEIYQGGAVPGKLIRIVEIPDIDVEACGGTHLNRTSEIGRIRILKTTKIQDGIVRITYTAGKASEGIAGDAEGMLSAVATELGCDADQVPGRVAELFSLWKAIVKKNKDVEYALTSEDRFDGDALTRASETVKTQPEHLLKTIQRFVREIENKKNQ